MANFVKQNQNAKYYNAFNLINGIGPIAFSQMRSYFPSLEYAWNTTNLNEFQQAGLRQSLIEQIKINRPKINPDWEMEKLNKAGIGLITIEDNNYPFLLKEIYRPPALLYIRGKFQKQDNTSIGIVGTRKCTFYGKQITPFITAELCSAKLTIVSGLAKGIDTLAHKTALENNKRTIAVLGSGIDQQSIYPRINQRLAEQITENGALISEFPPRTPPLSHHFPQRNRIISGLSLGIVVIEAPEKSGALITARDALEQNREVFAIPGHIYSSNSIGPNNLIKMGAKLVSQTKDILEELNLTPAQISSQKIIKPDNPEEKNILKQLSQEPLHIDKIIHQSKLSTAVVNSNLLLMEIKGKIKNIGGNNYILNK